MAALAFAIGITWDSWFGAPLAAIALTAGLFLDYTTVPLAAALIALGVARGGRSAARFDAHPPVVAVLAALWLSRALWTPLREAVAMLHRVTFFTRLREMTGAGWPSGAAAAVLLLLVAIVVGVAAVIFVDAELRTLPPPVVASRLDWFCRRDRRARPAQGLVRDADPRVDGPLSFSRPSGA